MINHKYLKMSKFWHKICSFGGKFHIFIFTICSELYMSHVHIIYFSDTFDINPKQK